MLDDVRFALRVLNRHRAYGAIAAITIALGVGANAAVFSIADSVLFRPLPFHDVERLFVLRIADPRTGQVYGSLPGSAVDAARATGVLEGVAAASSRTWRAYIREGSGLDVLTLAPVSREYLQLLGLQPMLGRPFDASDAGTRAIVLSHRAWVKRYGGDLAIVGRSLPAILRPTERYPLDQTPLRVVGVLSPRTRLPLVAETDGLVLDEEATVGGPGRSFVPLVRLAPDIQSGVARARLEAIQGPELTPGKSVLRLVPLREELAAQQGSVVWLLLGASAIVLLVACVNLANLILARGVSRAREMAARAALGASRGRLARLLLAEALCITALGTLLGVAFAYWGFRILGGALPPLLARASTPVFDMRVLLFAGGLAAASAVLFSLWPIVRLSRADAQVGLRAGLEQFRALGRGRRVLVGAEVAICVLLLVGAGLVGRTLLTLVSQDLGFEPHRFSASFDLPTLVVKRGDTLRTDLAARSAFYLDRLREIRTLHGVRAAALTSAVPFTGIRPDAPLTDGKGEQAGGVYSVSSGYFRTLGIAMLAGRDMTDEESFSGAPVGVLNEAAAKMLCGAPAQCLGRTIHSPDQPARTVIGVVRDARPSLQRAANPLMFVPFQTAFALKVLVIDADLTRATRDQVHQALSVSPDARVDLQSLDEGRDRELAPFRFNAAVIGGFAGLTLILAVIGVGGVMSAIVGERAREYGIRMALGATRARLNRLVLSQAAVPIVLGAIFGLGAAAVAARYVASLLYGVAPLDAPSFAAALTVITAAGLGAALPAARRAGRVDPIVALKAE